VVNWGKVRWRGRQDDSDGDVRIQFRVGNSLDTQVYARFLGPGLIDTNDDDGVALNLFSWIKIAEGRVPERQLQYNELGVDIGDDGELGWSFWSAPFKLAEGNVAGLPESEWTNSGVPLPLPGGTRYIQFRVLFDSQQHSAGVLDFIEFDYDTPLTSGGVLAEIFPPRVPLGEETSSARGSPRMIRHPSTASRSPCPALPPVSTHCASMARPGWRSPGRMMRWIPC
jgi:hypothetical protein